MLDIFQFADGDGFLRLNAEGPALLERTLQDVVAGREEVTRLLERKERGSRARGLPGQVTPVVHFAHDHSHRFTVLEIVAQDAPGLLHRISRVISAHGCNVDLVIISTEGQTAIDVFHLTRAAAKLADSDRTALGHALASMLEDQ